jgi:hypothetical protein
MQGERRFQSGGFETRRIIAARCGESFNQERFNMRSALGFLNRTARRSDTNILMAPRNPF